MTGTVNLNIPHSASERLAAALPYRVERHDLEGGAIAYEVWDTRPGSYRRLCTLDDFDNPQAKHDSEVIADALNSSMPTVLPWDAFNNRSYEPVERRAKEIYEARLSVDPQGKHHPWVDGGNSEKQDDARVLARREIRETPNSPEQSQ